MHPFLRYATEHQRDIIALIQALVECESPSNNAAAVNRCANLLADRMRHIASATTISGGQYGNHLRLEFKTQGRRQEGQILCLGHLDTVWPLSTLRTMPFRESEGRLWGPGVLDMKAGIAFAVYAVQTLRELDLDTKRKIVMLLVSDEEIGSHSSRLYTEEEARRSDVVLVLEPGTGLGGALKTSRKGVGNYIVRVHGKAAHSGLDFLAGANAVVELCRQVQEIAAFTDLTCGLTVSPGIISGGTRTNVVPAEAEVQVDVRVERASDAVIVDRKFHGLQPFDSRCSLTIEGGLNRPPMERTPAVQQLFRTAQEAGATLGVTLEESASGGGSDGNFTAGLGIPTLDGLGGVGEGAHAVHESILIDRIADRTALLAMLLQTL